MQAFEYLVGLAAILVGIALSDIAFSLHRLLRTPGEVRWHWQPLASTLLVLLLVLDLWWSLRQLEQTGITMTVGLFLPLLSALFVFFLLAAATLPDEVPPAGLDLQSYYDGNRRYFWTLFAIYILLTTVHVFAVLGAHNGWRSTLNERLTVNLLPNLLIVVLAASLALTRRAWWHAIVILFLTASLLSSHLTRPLT